MSEMPTSHTVYGGYRYAGGLTVTIPLRTYSEANRREHWRVKAARVKQQRQTTRLYLSQLAPPQVPTPWSAFLLVTITRMAPSRFDSDNLAISAKAIRDEIAAWIGVDDGSPLYRWEYAQEKSKDYGVRVEIANVPNRGEAR